MANIWQHHQFVGMLLSWPVLRNRFETIVPMIQCRYVIRCNLSFYQVCVAKVARQLDIQHRLVVAEMFVISTTSSFQYFTHDQCSVR
jgi:hypothetical protein